MNCSRATPTLREGANLGRRQTFGGEQGLTAELRS
jgi:hypothetical protein